MREGRVVQAAAPDELWSHPLDLDVARFLGIGNVDGQTAVRPEAVSVRRAAEAGDGTVERAVRTGPAVRLIVRLDDGRRLEALSTELDHPAANERVDVEIDPEGIIRLP
jgi:ABC-type Fe3+/spermidine/putrescine transport system ATPase subunit